MVCYAVMPSCRHGTEPGHDNCLLNSLCVLADGTLLIYKAFRRPSKELCFLRLQLQQAMLYEAPPAPVSSTRTACIKPFDSIVDGSDAFIR